MDAAAPFDAKARHLRALYRGRPPQSEVRAEFDRLFPEGEARLDQILVNAWIEGRQLAGWRRDEQMKRWHRADGSVVLEDTGDEWIHL